MSGLQAFNLSYANQTARNYSADLANAEADLAEAYAQVRLQNAEIKRLNEALALQKATVVGREAQIDALRAEHTSSPLYAASGQTFSSEKVRGQPKDKLRVIFEKAFDQTARKLGIINPATRRFN